MPLRSAARGNEVGRIVKKQGPRPLHFNFATTFPAYMCRSKTSCRQSAVLFYEWRLCWWQREIKSERILRANLGNCTLL